MIEKRPTFELGTKNPRRKHHLTSLDSIENDDTNYNESQLPLIIDDIHQKSSFSLSPKGAQTTKIPTTQFRI